MLLKEVNKGRKNRREINKIIVTMAQYVFLSGISHVTTKYPHTSKVMIQSTRATMVKAMWLQKT